MNRKITSALAMTTAVLAIAAAAAIASGNAFADDITVESTPFVSTRTSADVKAEFLNDPMRHGANEWVMQYNQPTVFKGTLTPEQVRAAYITDRDEVNALNGEDSGSNYLATYKNGRSATTVMGGPAR
jgi:hypothetical protein